MAGRKRRNRRASRQRDNDNDWIMQDSVDIEEKNGANAPFDHQTNDTQPKSKRLKTVQPVAPSPTRVDTADSDAESPKDDADTQPTGEDVPHPRTHTYGTRTRNQFRRPGQDIGLNWEETRKEKVAADAARAQKRAQEDLKRAKAKAKAQTEHDGIERIAELELIRQQEDDEENEYVGRTGTARGYRSASSKARMAQRSSIGAKNARNGAASGLEYQDDEEVCSSTEPESPQEGAEVERDEMAREPSQVREVQPAKKKPKTAAERKREKQKQVRGRIAKARENLPKKPGRNAGDSQAGSAAGPSDDEDDGEDGDGHAQGPNSKHRGERRPASAASASLSRSRLLVLDTRVHNNGCEDGGPTRVSLMKKSAQKGGCSGARARAAISDDDGTHSSIMPPNESRPKAARSRASTSIATARSTSRSHGNEEDEDDDEDDDDAFHPTYRAALRHMGSHPVSLHSTPTRAASHVPNTPTSARPTPFQLRFRIPGASPPPVSPPSAHRAATPIGDSETRGLNDEDVALSRESVLERPRGRQETTLQVVYAEADPPQKPKAKRTSQADMDPEDSLSGKNLPRWIKDEFSSRIMPTVLEHFGGQENPWKLDFDKPVKAKPVQASTSTVDSQDDVGIVDLVQELITSLFPRKKYELDSNDIIVRVARQRVLNWRRAFLDRAIKAAAAAHTQFKIRHPEATKRDVADWAEGAMDVNAGLGLWEMPPTDKDPKPHGGLRSPFLLQTFSPHFNSIRGSVLADSPPPIGALGLALAALDIAFDCYSSGVLKAPESKFDITNAGAATKEWYKLAVLPNMTPRKRWDTVMDVAKQHAPRGPSSSKSRAPARRRRSGVMPGSSPVRSEAM